MRQIMYTLQFTGHAMPQDAAGTSLKATTTPPSCSITTVVGPEGVRGTLQRVAGDTAAFESQVTFTGESTFQEEGTIAFGKNGHRLRFRTVGQGYLGPSADPARKHGTVMWQVEGGEGQFADASGLITSNFFVSEAGEVTDNHFGAIFVR
jgi:hypothetical protein